MTGMVRVRATVVVPSNAVNLLPLLRGAGKAPDVVADSVSGGPVSSAESPGGIDKGERSLARNRVSIRVAGGSSCFWRGAEFAWRMGDDEFELAADSVTSSGTGFGGAQYSGRYSNESGT